jgi:hypothetical protein
MHLSAVKIEGPRHRQIATEGALLGELATRGLHERLAVVSDDAGQFMCHGTGCAGSMRRNAGYFWRRTTSSIRR